MQPIYLTHRNTPRPAALVTIDDLLTEPGEYLEELHGRFVYWNRMPVTSASIDPATGRVWLYNAAGASVMLTAGQRDTLEAYDFEPEWACIK